MKSGSTSGPKRLTADEVAKHARHSQQVVWEQNRNPFVNAKIVHRVFNNTHLTLNLQQYLPQSSCPIYGRLRDKVISNDASRRKQLEARLNITKAVESAEPASANEHESETSA